MRREREWKEKKERERETFFFFHFIALCNPSTSDVHHSFDSIVISFPLSSDVSLSLSLSLSPFLLSYLPVSLDSES